MFSFNLEEAAVDEFFYSRFTIKFSFFFRFSTWKWSSVEAIMVLSAALPLVIRLNFFGLYKHYCYIESQPYLDYLSSGLKIFACQTSFQKRSVNTYLTWCQRRNWVASMIELTLIFNPSYVCRPTIWTIYGQHLFQNFLDVSEQNSANLGIT